MPALVWRNNLSCLYLPLRTGATAYRFSFLCLEEGPLRTVARSMHTAKPGYLTAWALEGVVFRALPG